MNLKEAIRYNEAIRKGIDKDEMPKHREAVGLGIEALKRHQLQECCQANVIVGPLPGETVEKED